MLAMGGLGEEIAAVRDFVKNLQPPSPPMVSFLEICLYV
jgi:hypothetical protein